MKKNVLVICLMLLFVSCESTTALLSRPSEEYVEVTQGDSDVNVEEQLKKSGKEYVCKDIYHMSGPVKSRRACFVKAPEISKYKNAGLKITELPDAIIEDAGTNIKVIGYITWQVFLQAIH